MLRRGAQFRAEAGGDTEVRSMQYWLLRSITALLPLLNKDKANLNRRDKFALDLLQKVLAKLDDMPVLGKAYTYDIAADQQRIVEKIPVPAGSFNDDSPAYTNQNLPDYVEGQARVDMEHHPKNAMISLSVDIDLVANLGKMSLPEGMPIKLSFYIIGNFTDRFYQTINMNPGLPRVNIGLFIDYTGQEEMYTNTLDVQIAPDSLPIEAIETRLKRDNVYQYKPDIVKALLVGEDIYTQARGRASAGVVHRKEIVQNLGAINIPGEGRVKVFLRDYNKSVQKLEP